MTTEAECALIFGHISRQYRLAAAAHDGFIVAELAPGVVPEGHVTVVVDERAARTERITFVTPEGETGDVVAVKPVPAMTGMIVTPHLRQAMRLLSPIQYGMIDRDHLAPLFLTRSGGGRVEVFVPVRMSGERALFVRAATVRTGPGARVRDLVPHILAAVEERRPFLSDDRLMYTVAGVGVEARLTLFGQVSVWRLATELHHRFSRGGMAGYACEFGNEFQRAERRFGVNLESLTTGHVYAVSVGETLVDGEALRQVEVEYVRSRVHDGLDASRIDAEVTAVTAHVERWLRREDVPFERTLTSRLTLLRPLTAGTWNG